jgi:hypothetical protein
MPPRYVYWTILIDDAPTAFRASDRDDLLPTLHQLQRKNKNVVVKWFARGKLWDSPEAERQAQTTRKPVEKRNRDWRPGGQHKDPRARFDKEAQRRKKREQRAARNEHGPAAGGEHRERRERPPDFNPPAPKRPWSPRPPGERKPWSSRPPSERKPWSSRPPGERKPWSSRPPGERKPWSSRPPGERKPWPSQPPGERKPWSSRPPGERKPWQKDVRSRDARGPKPWSAKPPRDNAHRPWRDRPGNPDRKQGPVRESEPKKRPEETPDRPPTPEQIVIKPKPPERG